MIIKSILATILLFVVLHYSLKGNNLKIDYLESSLVRPIIVGFFLLFVLIFYLVPGSYYFPHNNGVLGDNYLHLYWAFDQPGFLKPHHPLFPLIPEKFIRLLMGIKFLSVDDPMFLEKAYYWSIFPVSFSMAVALLLFFHMTFKKGVSNALLISIFFLFSTSYGFWIWAIQSNAIGISLAMELLIAAVFIYWYNERSTWWSAVLAILIGASIFLYNGLIYVALGTYLSMLWVVFAQRNKRLQLKIKELLVPTGILLLMASGYYLLEAHINHTYSLKRIFSKLSEVEYLGGFGISNILSSMESNFWSGINWIVGFFYTSKYNYWEPIQVDVNFPPGANWIKAFQIGALFTLIIFIAIHFLKGKQKPSEDLLVFGLINSLIIFIGFTIRMAGTHYYVLALVPNLILLVSFIVGKSNQNIQWHYIIPIVAILLCNIFFNSFTKLSVFEGSNISDHPYYFENESILNATKGEKAVYFKKMDLEYYPNKTLVLYYQDKFKGTNWITKWNDRNDLETKIDKSLEDSKEVFLSKDANDEVRHSKYSTNQLNEDLYLISVVIDP